MPNNVQEVIAMLYPILLTDTQAPTLNDLLDNVKTTEWFRLGLKLGIQQDILETIESKRLDASAALRALLREWLRACEDTTWVAMVTAMREIGEGRCAKKLKDKFCSNL